MIIKKDLNFIRPKFEQFEKKNTDFENDLYDFKKDIEKFNDTCSRTVKMVDYLGGQVIQSYQPDLEKVKQIEENKSKIDLSIYLTKSIFKDEMNLIYKRLEKIVEYQKDNYNNIMNFENKLQFFITENDLKNVEHFLKNELEEYKIYSSRKFLEKNEALKNYKYLELQIKNISENFLNNTNNINNINTDNLLFAKKPINNYICASCDSYIGEANNKTQYIPLNKIFKDEKKFRMGHGFSRMLQMVNADLLKNAEKINNDLLIKNDDKKTNNINFNYNNSVISEGKQKHLPRINSQINFHKMNIMNQTPRDINLEYTKSIEKENNESSSNSTPFINNIDNDIKSYTTRNRIKENDSNNSPKLLKIYKKIKK